MYDEGYECTMEDQYFDIEFEDHEEYLKVYQNLRSKNVTVNQVD